MVESWRGGRPTRQSLTPQAASSVHAEMEHRARPDPLTSHSAERPLTPERNGCRHGGSRLGWHGQGRKLSYFKASMSVNSLTESATKAS